MDDPEERYLPSSEPFIAVAWAMGCSLASRGKPSP